MGRPGAHRLDGAIALLHNLERQRSRGLKVAFAEDMVGDAQTDAPLRPLAKRFGAAGSCGEGQSDDGSLPDRSSLGLSRTFI